MARKKDSPQKAAMREMMRDYLKNNDISIKDGTDVNSIMRDMMSVLLEGALDEELDEELGYSKYDYRNKETDNSRNGHSSKTMHTSYGDMDVAIPRDRNGEYSPQLIKKYQNTVTQDMEGKHLTVSSQTPFYHLRFLSAFSCSGTFFPYRTAISFCFSFSRSSGPSQSYLHYKQLNLIDDNCKIYS